MQNGVRIPRFQRNLHRAKKREKTPYITRGAIGPEALTQVAENLSVLVMIIFNDNPCHFTKEHTVYTKPTMDRPQVKLRSLLRHIFASTRYSLSTASISLYYVYKYITDTSNVRAFESKEAAVVAALMIANKAYDDTHISSTKWSQLCNIPSRVLVESELFLLEGLEWSLHLSSDEFMCWGQKMHEMMMLEGTKRKRTSVQV